MAQPIRSHPPETLGPADAKSPGHGSRLCPRAVLRQEQPAAAVRPEWPMSRRILPKLHDTADSVPTIATALRSSASILQASGHPEHLQKEPWNWLFLFSNGFAHGFQSFVDPILDLPGLCA